MELLEERADALILLSDNRRLLRVMEKNPYALLKFKYYQGKKIRFVGKALGTISIEETDSDGIFECTFNGTTVTISDSQIEVASAIFDARAGNLNKLYSLWKLKHAERFLDIRVELAEGNSPVELTREGKLLLPKSVLLQILEWVEHRDGGRVVKAVLSREHASAVPVDRIFTHEVQVKGRTRVIINDTAVALIGRDETNQCWMHVVPPEYNNRSISSCEMWLSGGEEGKDELIDALNSK